MEVFLVGEKVWSFDVHFQNITMAAVYQNRRPDCQYKCVSQYEFKQSIAHNKVKSRLQTSSVTSISWPIISHEYYDGQNSKMALRCLPDPTVGLCSILFSWSKE